MIDPSQMGHPESHSPLVETLGALRRAQDMHPEVRRVRFPLEPFDDESLLGYLWRVASWNVLGGVSALLSPLGIGSAHGLSAALAPVSDRFAASLRIPQSKLQRMLTMPISDLPGQVDYFGAPLRRCHLDYRRRRVSPASLRRSDHHRANWMIGTLPFCPDSWELLLHRCRCGVDLGWRVTHGIAFCDLCRADLRQLRSAQVPEEQREELAFLAGLVSPLSNKRARARELAPARFQHLEPTWIYELALGLGRDPEAFGRRGTVTTLTVEALSLGARLLLGYPKTFEAHAQRRLDNETRSPIFMKLQASGRLSFDPNLKAFVTDLIAEFEPVKHGPSRLKAIRKGSGRMSLTEVAIRLGVDNAAVKRLSRERAFETGRPRGARRLLQWFEPNSVEPVAKAFSERLSLNEFSRRFHLPFDGVEQLFSLGLLPQNNSPYVRILHPDANSQISDLALPASLTGFGQHPCPVGAKSSSSQVASDPHSAV